MVLFDHTRPFIAQVCLCVDAGIEGGEETHALAAGINLMLWHDVTSGICQLQVNAFHADKQCKPAPANRSCLQAVDVSNPLESSQRLAKTA